MKDAQKLIIGGLIALVLLGGFWIHTVSPKRSEATKLDKQLTAAKSELVAAQADVATAEQAKEEFPADYQQVLLLGKAVPEGDDTASLLVQLQKNSAADSVDFRELALNATSTAAPAVPVTGATPTEAAAANLPLGATVGTAGLGVLPYTVTVSGSFFDITHLLGTIDGQVKTEGSRVVVDGRLLTIDGFSLAGDGKNLSGTLAVNSFVTPPGQGITAGATSAAPAAVSTPLGATPASATTTTTTP